MMNLGSPVDVAAAALDNRNSLETREAQSIRYLSGSQVAAGIAAGVQFRK